MGLKTFLFAIVFLLCGYIYWTFGDAQAVKGDPIVTVAATPTATPRDSLAITTPTATPAPAIEHGEAQRMQFARGTYGGSYAVGTWTLWARQGQVLTLAGAELVNARLTAPGGEGVTLVGNRVTLPATGDYTLTVAGLDQFGIEIR
jgi:hypothetical protein